MEFKKCENYKSCSKCSELWLVAVTFSPRTHRLRDINENRGSWTTPPPSANTTLPIILEPSALLLDAKTVSSFTPYEPRTSIRRNRSRTLLHFLAGWTTNTSSTIANVQKHWLLDIVDDQVHRKETGNVKCTSASRQ